MKVGYLLVGCDKMRVDLEKALGGLSTAGHEIVDDPDGADAIVVATCAFTNEARDESVRVIVEAAEARRRGMIERLAVIGCLPEIAAGELREEIPEIDGILPFGDLADLPKLLDGEGRTSPDRMPNARTPLGRLPAGRFLTTHGLTSFVKISEGCSRGCAFCSIPRIRGDLVSRPADEIEEEVRQLAESGVREIILVSQDSASYGTSPAGGPDLPGLIRRLGKIDGPEWFRVMYLSPLLPAGLLDAINETPGFIPYFDIPIQHASPTVLKAMGRPCDTGRMKETLLGIRERFARSTLRTTVILGHPGEGDDEFDELLDFVRDLAFDRLGAFVYSPEEGTRSALMDHPDPEIVRERFDILSEIQDGISRERLAKRIGEETVVMVEEFSGGTFMGRTDLEAPEIDGQVRVEMTGEVEIPSFVRARIVSSDEHDLEAVAI